jgi:transposase
MKMRTEVLREVRKMRFLEVYDRYVGGRLSLVEAAETLGLSERQFRRVHGRFAAEGEAGLLDRRLGKVSPHRIAADEVDRIVALYRDRYAGWTAKHFHERATERHGLAASYGWTKSVLTAAGLRRSAVKRSAHRKKRPRRPMVGMMLHQDGSRHLWLPALERQIDLIVTMGDATSEIYSAFFVDEEGTASSFRALHEVVERHGVFCTLRSSKVSAANPSTAVAAVRRCGFVQRLRARAQRLEQSLLRSGTLRIALRRLAAPCRCAARDRPGNEEHARGASTDLRRHARAEVGCRCW